MVVISLYYPGYPEHPFLCEWRKNGKVHREDGPAIINKHGEQFNQYYLNGYRYSTPTRYKDDCNNLASKSK